MTTQKDSGKILDFLICPGFSVSDHIITEVNQAAAAMLLTPGTDVRSLLLTGEEDYAAFTGGCMYVTLNIGHDGWGAALIRRDGIDYFLLDQANQSSVLQVLALAAQDLRRSLSSALISADQLSQHMDSEDTESREQLSRLNRGLYRTLRLIGNMSDAGSWPGGTRQEIREAGKIMAEIFQKAQAMTESLGITLHYTPLTEQIYTLINHDQLERAVLNLLSNALKFTPSGGTIQAVFRRSGKKLLLTITDTGCGIQKDILSTIFQRYLRQPGLEDTRFGLGLGMTLVRNAASAHGGTVLIDQPEGFGTRVTMTIAINQNMEAGFHSPILGLDYSGELDHMLLELSDCLPAHFYE